MNAAKKQSLKNSAKLWGAVLVIIFFLATVVVLASGNERAGRFMAFTSVAIIGIMICAGAISSLKNSRRLLRYGYESCHHLPSVMLPDDGERLAAAAELLTGEDGAACSSGRELIELLRARGLLFSTGRDYTLPGLLGGLNGVLASMPEKPDIRLTEDMIVSLDNPFTANRRSDGADTTSFDLCAAAYLLRGEYIEPALLFATKAPQEDGSGSADGGRSGGFDTGALNIILVPTGRMHALFDIFKAPRQG